jgi:putative transposase
MIVMDQFSRKIVGFAVHQGSLDGPAICLMFNQISSGLKKTHIL